jgi:acetyl esterase
LLYYPVLDVNFETESYQKYKDDIFLPRRTMEYVWEAYMNDPSKDKYVSTVVPMAAAPEELVGLPPALIVTAERDVLRDEGEAFAKRLAAADVPCLSIRFQGVGHGFVTMPVLKAQAHGAILQSVDSLRKAWNQNDSKM